MPTEVRDSIFKKKLRKKSFPGNADDGYIKGKLSVVLQVLAELKRVLKEDAGLELNISKTAILSKAITRRGARLH